MTSPTLQASRDAYYAQLDGKGLAPLLESLHALVPREPRPRIVPALWKYDAIRPLVMQAGAVISAEEAVRRVLILENPGLPGKASPPVGGGDGEQTAAPRAVGTR